MQQTDRVLLTAMALYDWYEAMEVSRNQLIFAEKVAYSVYSMYGESGSKHPS